MLKNFLKKSQEYNLLKEMAAVQNSTVAFHLAADYMSTPLHVEVWAQHLKDAGVDWYVIARELRHLRSLQAAGIKGVWAGSANQLRQAVGPNVRSIIYANNSHKNVELLRRFPDLVHAQLLHGDSDKPTSYNPVTRNFDEIWVAGQLGQDRYAMNGVTVPDRAFVHVGRPQVKGRTVGPRADDWRDKPVIAYMPTWFGSQGDMMLSSLDRGASIIRAIRKAAPTGEILYKPHPLAYKDPNWGRIENEIAAALAETGGVEIAKESDASQVYERADILVSDISSTMSDYLWSNRPIVVIAPHGFAPDMRKLYPSLGGSLLVHQDLRDLDEKLLDSLSKDSLAEDRHSMRKYSFGEDDGRPADARFIDEVRRLAGL